MSHAHGECRQRMVHGGNFLVSDFVFHGPEHDDTGTGVIGFDPRTDRFTSFWYDSRSTRLSIRQSDGAFDGTRVELRSRSLDADGDSRTSRTVTLLEDGDRHLVHRQFVPTADGGERLLMELSMTRRTAPHE